MPSSRLSGERAFLAGGGELGALLRARDWSNTPLGDPEAWPQSLKTAVRIMLASRQPIWIGWGEALTYLYNDAYKSIIGGKHPWALGRPTSEVWREIWSDIGPMLESAMGGVEGTYVEEQLLIMERNGYPEETYYTFSYTPIPDDHGAAGGIICANTDDTARVIGERQVASLRELAAALVDVRTWEDVCARSIPSLANNSRDVTFAMIYMAEPGADELTLAGAAGVQAGTPIAPPTIPLAGESAWPVARCFHSHVSEIMTDLAERFGPDLPKGAWSRTPSSAAILPIPAPAGAGRAGVLILGLNPFRLFDADYDRFLTLASGQIAAAIASAQAYQHERRRAEALAEIDRAKTTFFSNVSHEFRTPLTLMLGPLEDMLLEAMETRRADLERLRLIHRNGLRLLKLVNALLDFSRMEAGRARVNLRPTDLSAFTRDLVSNFESACARAGLDLDVDLAELPRPVQVDREMWEKIVLNLLSNALKFTFDGGISVALETVGDRAVLTVRDTGTGIPASQIPHLFERFHRVDGARSRSHEGSGIGLALVHDLVRLHGGEVGVESEEGRGTTFTVAIPARFTSADEYRAEVGAASKPVPSPLRAQAFVDEALRWLPESATQDAATDLGDGDAFVDAAARPKSRPVRVLLADDNADMRGYVARLLLGAGVGVEAVGDGEQALLAARRRRPDLVLSDVMMPRLDGIGLLRELRADPELGTIPIILLSARAGEEAEIEGLAAGADDYLIKPFSARELIARVEATVALARARNEAADRERGLREAAEAAEAAVEELNANLERRVSEEIAARGAAEEQLRQAQKMEAVGQLTGGIAHDFNNLLTIVLGNIDTLLRHLPDSNPERVRRAAENAMQGVRRAVILTQRLLAFSRRQPLEPKSLELNRLVAGMSDLLRRTLGEKVEIQTVLAGGLWLAEADPNQLESALLNLAVNSRDAMPGGGKLTIETANAYLDENYVEREREVRPGQYVMLAVSDTGIGMNGQILERVFEPFFTTKPLGHGTGLGLSQVYGFVKQSGGHVKIYSEEGEGTTVRIYLPRFLGRALDEERSEPRPPDGGQTETILVVEDEAGVRDYACELLRELGYAVLEAEDARKALKLLAERDVDLLFTDVGLPGMNGRELVEEARRLRPGLKVLFTTGYARNAIVHQGRLDPGVNLIAKPFTYSALGAKIRSVLDFES